MDTKTFTLTIPASVPGPANGVDVISHGSVVIVGANGSGKTRLGTFIETANAERVHRISAQKSLEMPRFSSTSSVERARAKLRYGTAEGNLSHRISNRWNQKPNTFLLNDYQALVEYLFTDDYVVSREYKESAQATRDRLAPPESRLDIIKRIWEEILPNRQLVFKDGQIDARVTGSSAQTYNAAEMSDGERVIFYLIGQALLAPENGLLIIDEPELHLHESIQAALWDKIEAERPDSLFIYFTHDLDFAASRANATKICLRGFDGERWDWYHVPQDSEMPEEILLEILGSRKPVIFTEGDRGSLDYFVYQKLYPDFTILPSGRCDDVIHATRSFASLKSLHRLSVHGLVDRDLRENDEADYLKSLGVEVLDYSELENLFLTEGVLRIVAQELHREDIDDLLNSVKAAVLEEMRKNSEILISSIAARKIERTLNTFNAKARGESELSDALVKLTKSIDVKTLYHSTEAEVLQIVDTGDYESALKIYNNKGLIYRISGLFGLKSNELIDFTRRLMSSKAGGPLLTVMRGKTPQIPH